MLQRQNKPQEIELSFHVNIIKPQRSPRDDDQKGIEYFTPRQSDRHRKVNQNFGENKGDTVNERQTIIVTRNDGTDPNNNLYSLHELPLDNAEDLETSYYTFLIQEIGRTRDGQQLNYYVNPMTIAKSMEYCRPQNYVYWADIPKYEFDRKTYDQCVDFLLSRSLCLEEQASDLLSEDYKFKSFDRNLFYPVMILGVGAFGFILLVLSRVNNVNTTVPYALKFQKIPSANNRLHNILKRGATYEPYFYSRLEHPNILRMFDFFENVHWRIQLFEYMPYGGLDHLMYVCDDLENLCEYMNRHNKLKDFDAVKLLRFYSAQLLMAFEYLHSLNVIHMDIKRNNIGIGYRGYLKLFDFGGSHPVKEVTLGVGDDVINTGAYMCKERKEYLLQKDVTLTTATDIYGFSILFLQIFSTWISKKVLNVSSIDVLRQGRARSRFYEESTKIIKEFVDSNKSDLEQLPYVLEVFEGSFHYDDFENRMTAKELLNLEFYSHKYINKQRLFKQSYDLEAELKIDLKDLFVLTHFDVIFKYFNARMLPELGKTYVHPKHWNALKCGGGQHIEDEDDYVDDVDDYSWYMKSIGKDTMKKFYINQNINNRSRPETHVTEAPTKVQFKGLL